MRRAILILVPVGGIPSWSAHGRSIRRCRRTVLAKKLREEIQEEEARKEEEKKERSPPVYLRSSEASLGAEVSGSEKCEAALLI